MHEDVNGELQGYDTREMILTIAESIIRGVGYSNLRYDDIAYDMPIKSASIHYWFPYKVELGLEVVKRYCGRVHHWRDEIDARLEDHRLKTHFDCLEAYVKKWRDYVAEDTYAPLCICVRVLMDLEQELKQLDKMKMRASVSPKHKQKPLQDQIDAYESLKDEIHGFFKVEVDWIKEHLLLGLSPDKDHPNRDGSVNLVVKPKEEDIPYVGSTTLSIIHGGMIAMLAVNADEHGNALLEDRLKKEREQKFIQNTDQLLAQLSQQKRDEQK